MYLLHKLHVHKTYLFLCSVCSPYQYGFPCICESLLSVEVVSFRYSCTQVLVPRTQHLELWCYRTTGLTISFWLIYTILSNILNAQTISISIWTIIQHIFLMGLLSRIFPPSCELIHIFWVFIWMVTLLIWWRRSNTFPPHFIFKVFKTGESQI